MSVRSKVVLGCSVVFATSAIVYSFYAKEVQLLTLKKGVEEDRLKRQLRKQNLIDLERQQEVEKQYKDALAVSKQHSEDTSKV